MKPPLASLENPAESAWVERARRHDFTAFEALVALHRSRVHGLSLLTLQDPTAAEQAVEATFLAAWGLLPRLDAGAPFLPWLLRLSADQLSRRILQSTSADRGQLAQPQFSADGHLVDETSDGAANNDVEPAAGVVELPRLLRAALVFRDLGHLSCQELAALLGTSTALLRRRLHEARLSLATTAFPEILATSSAG